MDFRLLENATNNFSEELIVGTGPNGVVYKGKLENGKEIAVKKLHPRQPFDIVAFEQQCNNLMSINHQNIVRLVSCCHEIRHKHLEYKGELVFARTMEVALVSEYLQGESLDKHVSDEHESRGLHWHTRYKIIKGICEGLNYLHNGHGQKIYNLNLKLQNILLDKNMVPKIGDFGMSRLLIGLPDSSVHHETYTSEGVNYLQNGHGQQIHNLLFKPQNILLDKNMVPKITDFGLSKLFTGLRDSSVHHETNTAGMIQYIPPEYNNGLISKKLDIFGLGIIIGNIMAGTDGFTNYAEKIGLISKKFDIFSLGIIIIQIMAGDDAGTKYAEMPPQEFIELVHENWRKRFQTALLFPSASLEVRTCIEIALRCVKPDIEERPTINEIVNELNKIDTSPMGQVYRTREFTFRLLDRITNHFSSDCELGRGGFGVVYKGILDDGEEIAVKKLYSIPQLDDHQFNNELNNLKTMEHPNIVRLVGYCHDTTLVNVEHNGRIVSAAVEERALCYEYLEKGSLESCLSDESCGLDWHTRYKIIRGVCEGLCYLQKGSKHPIYHLDLKPANILLDKDMMPKIGDFGLSRLFDSIQTYLSQSQKTTGTCGYMPPEYIDGHKISSKFDTFSLGVIIIQIMTGKEGHYNYATMPIKESIELVHENWKKRMQEAMSARTSEEVKTCIEIALRCVETNRKNRPTITEILDDLNNIGTAKSPPIVQWSNKLMGLKTLLSINFKHWLFLLLAIIIMYSSWPLLLSR